MSGKHALECLKKPCLVRKSWVSIKQRTSSIKINTCTNNICILNQESLEDSKVARQEKKTARKRKRSSTLFLWALHVSDRHADFVQVLSSVICITYAIHVCVCVCIVWRTHFHYCFRCYLLNHSSEMINIEEFGFM